MNAPDPNPPPLAPGLYVVGTPIGNLGDITLRALDTLRTASAIFAEDTRQTRKLLTRYDIHTPLVSCHQFNEAQRREKVLDHLDRHEAVALVTDAGMPGVSDPGGRVVAACHEAGHPVFAVPGPTAVTTGLALSGLGAGGFIFAGFLPPKSAARRRRLSAWLELAGELPVVIYESTHRIRKLLADLSELAPDHTVYAGRELTKRFEESVVGTPGKLVAHFEQRSIKGEWVLVISLTLNRRDRHS